MGLFCEKNQHPASLTDVEREVFEKYRDRQLSAPFIDRQTSALLDMMNAILDADHLTHQPVCPYSGRELWEMREIQGQRMLIPLT